MATCKGYKKDGTPCRSPIVLGNGYCHAHQDQAPEAGSPEEPVRWTRELLEAAIAAHGGPEWLDLAGADLSNLDLHGIFLPDARLQKAVLEEANLQEANLWGANLQEANLYDADLRGATLVSANLQEANLYDADLQRAELWGADLRGANLWGADLRGATLVNADLQGADLHDADLQGADLGRSDLRGAKLWKARLQGATLWWADLRGANLQFTNLREVDLLDVATGGLLGIKLWRAKLGHTALKREQLGPAIGDELAGEYREAREAYLALKQNFEGLGDYDAAGWAYRKERRMEKLEAHQKARIALTKRKWRAAVTNCMKYAGDQLVELVCDYGEGIWRVIRTLIFVWIFLALIYGLIAGVWGPWQDTNFGQIRHITRNPLDLLWFSLGTMVTLHPPGLEARSTLLMRVLTPSQALLCIFLAGLLGFVLGNRIRRS